MRWSLILILVLMPTFLAGCGSGTPKRLAVYPVKGSMVFEKKPATGAMIAFHPKGGDAAAVDLHPTAVVQADGSFRPTTYNHGDGLPVGEYSLSIYWPKPSSAANESAGVESANRLPAKYEKPESSGLTFFVKPEPNEFAPTELTR